MAADPEVFARARAVFDAVVDLGAAARAARLAAEPPAVRELAGQWLAAEEDDDSVFLTRPSLGVVKVLADLLVQAEGVPERIGPYLVSEELGRGTMGVVYGAEHAQSGAPVALKTLSPFGRSAGALARFRAEVEVLSRLRHPGIPQVHGCLDEDGTPVLVMERIEGPLLAPLLAEAPLDRGAARTLLQRLISAVAHAHDSGVVHRDIKPGNVRLRASPPPRTDPAPVLLDFGIAALSGGPGAAAGTLDYVAPEQLLGESPSPAADVYSLGALGWQLLTGAVPQALEGCPPDEAVAAKQALQLDPSALHPADRALVDALCPRPEDRPPTAAALAQALGLPD
jgi:serine/threonine-protein kinase